MMGYTGEFSIMCKNFFSFISDCQVMSIRTHSKTKGKIAIFVPSLKFNFLIPANYNKIMNKG
jgi:hypothetical protein